jgi:hypothetical protein
MGIYWGESTQTTSSIDSKTMKYPIEAHLRDIHYQLQALDVALTALARHEREVTGDTVNADNATKNIINIADALFEDGYM